MERGKITLHGIEYEVEGHPYDNGDGDRGVIFKFISPSFPFEPLITEKELNFNDKNLTYEPQPENSKENEGSQPKS